MSFEKRLLCAVFLMFSVLLPMTGCEQLQSARENLSGSQKTASIAGQGYTIDRKVDNTPTGPLPALLKSHGQTVYVPVYSNLSKGLTSSGSEIIIPLMTNVSVRNVDPAHALTITASRYYDTAGKVLGEYLSEPRILGPLETLTLVVKQSDLEGGIGANFLISWESDEKIITPIIEAIVAGSQGTQGYAFRVPGKVIARRGNPTE